VVEAISVSGSQVTGSGTSTITVNPADDLAYSTEHYVLIDATAFDDASSNSYAGISDITALSFTTATVPGAPTALAGSLPGGAGEIALTWTAPSSDGGVAISDYIVEYSTDGTTWTTFSDGGSSTASATVTGLANSTAYTFRVSGVNAAGAGTVSATTSATTATTPGQPTVYSVTQQFVPGGLTVSWNAPTSNGGTVITHYILEHSQDLVTWTTADASVTGNSLAVTGLNTDLIPVTFRVSAVNAVGSGPWSSWDPQIEGTNQNRPALG
jgi:titin